MRVYVCECFDSLCDIGKSCMDGRAYRTREAAERRARRLTYEDCDGVRHWACVHELEACWEGEWDTSTSTTTRTADSG